MSSKINFALFALIFWMCFQRSVEECYHPNDITYVYEVTDSTPEYRTLENGTKIIKYLRGNIEKFFSYNKFTLF
jgi:hypothetical protein